MIVINGFLWICSEVVFGGGFAVFVAVLKKSSSEILLDSVYGR